MDTTLALILELAAACAIGDPKIIERTAAALAADFGSEDGPALAAILMRRFQEQARPLLAAAVGDPLATPPTA
jgi:hypothetical protein